MATVSLDAFTGAVQASNVAVWPGVNHVLGASANYALVLVSHEAGATVSVTFGGVTMNVGPVGGPAASSNSTVRSFWLAGSSLPAAGTVSVVVDPTGNISGYVGIWTLIGAAPKAPNRSDGKTANTGLSVAPTLASVPAGAFCVSGSNHNTNAAVTLTGGTDKYQNGTAIGGQRGVFGESAVASPGTITHTYAGSSNERRAGLLLEIIPNLVASSLSVAAASLGQPVIGTAHALTTDALDAAAVVFGEPDIGQVHAIAASDLDIGLSFGQPEVADNEAELEPDDLSLAPLDLPALALVQIHDLAATGLDAAAAILDEPAVGQVHALATGDFDAAAVELGEPDVAQLGAFAPAAIVDASNLSGALGDIDDDPDVPDGNWLTATVGGTGIDLLVRFAMPKAGATLVGAQNFRTWLRKTAETPDTSVDVMLYEWDGSGDVDLETSWDLVATLSDDLAVTSESGQLDQHDWTASQLTDPTRPVAIRITGGGA